jgi:hypothetical protein
MEDKIEVSLEFTPLGTLNVVWKIPTHLTSSKTEYELELPGFKYDLPRFLSVPVPTSSKAIPVEIAFNASDCHSLIDLTLKDASYSNKKLCFKIKPENDQTSFAELRYTIKNLMNSDGIYFVAVYPFNSFLPSISHDIQVKAKFSYNIRKYVFWERYFGNPNGTKGKIKNLTNFSWSKNGDELIANGSLTPNSETTLDIHITGTRFPIFIRRDYFWIIVFLVALTVFLSPYLSFIFS